MFVWPTFGYFFRSDPSDPARKHWPSKSRRWTETRFRPMDGWGYMKPPGSIFFVQKVVNTVDEQNIQLTSWYCKYPIIYRVSYMSGGAGFLPSTACLTRWWLFNDVVWFFLPLYLLGETNGKRFLIWWQACFIQRGWNHQLVIFPRMTKSIDPDSVHYNI